MGIFQKINQSLDLKLQILASDLEARNDLRTEYNCQTGQNFNEIINTHAISEEELLKMAKICARYHLCTLKSDIGELLFSDEDNTIPRIRP